MLPNGFWGNGPGNGDDSLKERDREAYNISRMQFTVATSTFAGIALVGMFCSCLWFACCRHTSKSRKKGRTWATANPEAGLNPYSYEGFSESQAYMQMNNDGVAPYMSNPLYPSTFYGDNGLPSAYDFDENFGFNVDGGKAAMCGTDGLNNTLFCGTAANTNLKDVPPSYTALFFAASDNGIGGSVNKTTSSASTTDAPTTSTDPLVTNIQPIHLKVTSTSLKDEQVLQKTVKAPRLANDNNGNANSFDSDDDNDFAKYSSEAPPVSLMSVESTPGNEQQSPEAQAEERKPNASPGNKYLQKRHEETQKNPPPYNPGFNGYSKF